MKKLKDINVMALDDKAISRIVSKLQRGESTKQEAFDDLIKYCVKVLEPFTEERPVGLRLVTGALEKLRKLMEGTILDDLKLGSTYCAPARQLAKYAIERTAPTALEYVLAHFKANGDTEAGDLPGPLFAPTRLQVSMKYLRAKDEESKFEVSDDDILMVKDKSGTLHRFGSLSIARLIDILRDGTTTKGTLDLIVALVGEFTPEGTDDKPGTLGRAIAKVTEAANAVAEGEKPDQFALDLCESLTEAMMTAREATIHRAREKRAEAEAEADMARTKKRLEKNAALGIERDGGDPASVVLPDGSEAQESAEETESDED